MSVTLIIILITSAISYYAMEKPEIRHKLLFIPARVNEGEWYRLLSSGFIHADFSHLIFNMITLYFFGENLEYLFGSTRSGGSWFFVLLYLTAIVISELPGYFKHRHSRSYASLGASGGVAAVLFSHIMYLPFSNVCFFLFICLPGFVFGGLYLAYTVYMSKRGGDNVNHDAHFYGAIYGVAFTLVYDPSVILNFSF